MGARFVQVTLLALPFSNTIHRTPNRRRYVFMQLPLPRNMVIGSALRIMTCWLGHEFYHTNNISIQILRAAVQPSTAAQPPRTVEAEAIQDFQRGLLGPLGNPPCGHPQGAQEETTTMGMHPLTTPAPALLLNKLPTWELLLLSLWPCPSF